MKKINIIFKTHLDIGFTDTAAKVKKKYFNKFIKRAIKTSAYFRNTPGGFRYVWTVGSWLIYEYLERADEEKRRLLEEAIERGDIVWHALPFTTHSELADDSLFRYGISLSKELDKRFHKKTIAAKLTDVPGHTRAIIAPLADAGIKLLHIGINPASAMPDVPPIFRWRDSGGKEILVVYQAQYGDVIDLGDTEYVIEMTGDNVGPHLPSAVKRILKRYPDAKVQSGTLNDLAKKLLKNIDSYPVVTSEIGDTWIHGIETDPKKVADFKELLRLRNSWKEDFPEKARFSRLLLEAAEHTWGLDEKNHYIAPRAWSPKKLKTPAARQFASSWREKRKLLKKAIDALPADKRSEACRAVKKIRPFESIYLDRCVTENTVFENKFFRIEIDPDRACAESIYLKANKFEFKNSGLFQYETFTREDYDRFRGQYLRLPDVSWAIHDFTKPDLPKDIEKISCRGFSSNVHETVWGHGSRVTLCTNTFPGFRRVEIEYVLLDYSNELEIRVRWFAKQPERLPHAAWCSFASSKSRSRYMFRKMNEFIDPADVVSRGARTLHAVEEVVIDDKALLVNLDSPLVAPGKPSLLNFHNKKPDLKGGVHFNLYNNVWGTNFPMWFGDNMLFRYRIKAL